MGYEKVYRAIESQIFKQLADYPDQPVQPVAFGSEVSFKFLEKTGVNKLKYNMVLATCNDEHETSFPLLEITDADMAQVILKYVSDATEYIEYVSDK